MGLFDRLTRRRGDDDSQRALTFRTNLYRHWRDEQRRPRDEAELQHALTLDALVDEAQSTETPAAVQRLRGVADEIWAETLAIPRWQRAGVTRDNAEGKLAESRAGTTYTEDGRPVYPRHLRGLIDPPSGDAGER